MADLLVQNALVEVGDAYVASANTNVKYEEVFGKTLNALLEEIIRANPDDGNVYDRFTSENPNQLFALSCQCILAIPGCSFSGSTVADTCKCLKAHPWRNGEYLLGEASLDVDDIANAIFALNDKLSVLFDGDSIVKQQVLIEYYALKRIFEVENNTTVLANWYGIGIVPEVQGSPLSFTNRLKVCALNDQWKCGNGANCNWTVPDGASRVKFQVWGAGQGSNPGCCCGGQPFATTGSYAEAVFDVTPGETYTMCAGCSCQRSCCSNDAPGCGCASGVTGPGICCLYAGGQGCFTNNCNDLNHLRCVGTSWGGFAGSACRRFQNPACTGSGPCWCSNNEFCFDNSCATCGVVPAYTSCCHLCVCSCARTDRNPAHGPGRRIASIHGGGCLDTNNYGYYIRPPIIDSDTGLLFTDGCWNQTFTSGGQCGGCYAHSWTAHPGHGGAGTHVMGGTNNHKGDYGKGGMVQVSWV